MLIVANANRLTLKYNSNAFLSLKTHTRGITRLSVFH